MSTDTQSGPSPIRYGLIGTGTMGREHLRNIALIDGSEVVAVADPHAASRDAAREFFTGPVVEYADYATLLAEADIDALVVATPNDTHTDILLDVFESGRNVPILVEKPACTSAADVERLRAAAAEYSAPIWVAMEYRYMPPMRAFLEAVQDGDAGTPRMLAITEHRFPFLDKVGAWNRFSARSGGTLVEKACHFFDLMRLVLDDEPVRVYASGGADVNHKDESYDGRTPDILDNAVVVVDFAGGARAVLNLCMFAEGTRYQEHMSLVGDTAKIECFVPVSGAHWEGEERAAYLEFSPRHPQNPTRTDIAVDPTLLAAGGHHGATYYEHLAFQRAVRGEAPVEVTLEDGLRAVLMGMAAERSVVEHAPVELDFEREKVPA